MNFDDAVTYLIFCMASRNWRRGDQGSYNEKNEWQKGIAKQVFDSSRQITLKKKSPKRGLQLRNLTSTSRSTNGFWKPDCRSQPQQIWRGPRKSAPLFVEVVDLRFSSGYFAFFRVEDRNAPGPINLLCVVLVEVWELTDSRK